ncbi:MAG: RNA polymerase sigma factor [Candidatus Izemoplasmatales bacterium]|nr:RNA polymerase sigma factor [Candidatus Izemoplasmatales bacterium]
MENINFDDYIDLLIEKDDKAFEIIYEHTKRGVFSMIISIVHDKSQTEDLMQDTYIKMLKNIRSYQKGRNFNAWLNQIAKNVAIDFYRKTKSVSVYDPMEQGYVFDEAQEQKEAIPYEIEEMIQPLDSTERQIVLLHIVSDLKFKEIAASVEKPLGTVLWIYNKAIRKMKQHLEGGEDQ